MVSAIATQVGTKLLYRTLDDLYDFLKDKASLSINRARIKRRIPDLVSRINSFRMVKTLWRMESSVDIEEFYCASNVLIPTNTRFSSIGKPANKKRRKIDSVSDFGNIGNIVIRGIAGQGKSIFLRHLFIKEFKLGRRIPVFIELRRIQKNESLLDHITRFLDVLDLQIDTRLFRMLASSGKFIFFFDAFDEIPEKEKQRTLNELEYLAGISPGSQFLVTTRPDSDIEMSTLFTVTTLDYLKESEYQSVIRKLSLNRQFANTLIKAIKEHKSSICDLLCTPLLITLLIIEYSSFQELPEQMSDFYERIFLVLLQRHDRTKPGFIRPKLCLLNDSQYREVFDAFCFYSMKTDKSQFTLDDIKKSVSKAMQAVGVNEDSQKFLDDIINVTCMLLHEGKEYRFIHKSVQEYYAATFIYKRPENIVMRFYNACLDFHTWQRWDSELSFLAEIDKYRYNKYFLLPLCRKWIVADSDNELLNSCPPVTIQREKNIIGDIDIGWDAIRFPGKPYDVVLIGTGSITQIMDAGAVLELTRFNYKPLVEKIQKREIVIKHKRFSKKVISKGIFQITLNQIIDEGFLVSEMESFTKSISNHLYTLWKGAYEYTTQQESIDIISDPLSDY